MDHVPPFDHFNTKYTTLAFLCCKDVHQCQFQLTALWTPAINPNHHKIVIVNLYLGIKHVSKFQSFNKKKYTILFKFNEQFVHKILCYFYDQLKKKYWILSGFEPRPV